MLQDKTFYELENWKCYQTLELDNSAIYSFKKSQILNENKQGYILLFIEKPSNHDKTIIECYKKHATSILKFILIGKFPVPLYKKFAQEVDQLIQQTDIMKEAIQKPEFARYYVQKQIYFNLDD